MCGVVFGLDCARTTSSYLNWTLPIPPDERSFSGRTKRMKRNQEYQATTSSLPPKISQFGNVQYPVNGSAGGSFSAVPSPLISMVQITDIHIDPYYTPGMNADCGEPLCCRASDGYAGSSSKAAGPWGDYRNCDTPIASLKSALEHISRTHPDVSICYYIYYYICYYVIIHLLITLLSYYNLFGSLTITYSVLSPHSFFLLLMRS